MNRDELINAIKEIGTCEDSTERLSKLTDLQDNVSKVFDNVDLLTGENTKLKESNTKKDEQILKAQQYAMDMFLKNGEQKSNAQIVSQKTGMEEEKEPTFRSYEEIAKDFM